MTSAEFLESPLTRFAETFARAASSSAIVVGITGLMGWFFGVDVLRSVYSGLLLTTANSCFSLILTGIALRRVTRRFMRDRPSRHLVPALCALAVITLAAGSLAEYVLHRDLGIDELLFHRPAGQDYPVRMAPMSAVNLLIVDVAILMLVLKWRILIAQVLALLASFIGILAIAGYVFVIPSLYAVGGFTGMSVQMSVMSTVLGLGVLASRPDHGIMMVFAGPSVGGIVARRLLPLAVGFPFLLGLLVFVARATRIQRTPFGLDILLFCGIVAYSLPIIWTATQLYRLDAQRELAEKHVAEQYELIQRLNRELQGNAQRLESVNSELEAFSYSVSHDLRSPLRHIAGFTQLLCTHPGTVLDAQGHRYVSIITEACGKMDTLIEDLLAFSRTGRGEMLKTRVNLDDMVRRIIDEMTSLMDRQIDWQIHPMPSVEADPAMLRVALSNYISNAIKYTKKTPIPRIEIGATRSDSRITIYVRDNGAGFDMKYASKLFGVFQRLHREEEFEGNGIGLATARRIIARHGGETWAEGIPGKGANFYFSLPEEHVPGVLLDERVEIHSAG